MTTAVDRPAPVTGQAPSPDSPPSLVHRVVDWYVPRAPVVASRIAAALGVLALLDVLGPHRLRMLSGAALALPMGARAAASATVVAAGLLLLRVAAGLRRRKRAEWRLALAATAAVLVAGLVRDERHPVEAGFALLLGVALVVARGQFTAIADARSRWFAARVGLQTFLAAVVVGMVMLELPGHTASSVSVLARLGEVLRSIVGLGGGIVLHGDHFADVFHATMLTLGLGGAVAVVLLAVRRAEPPAELTADDEQRLREVLARQGERDSLGYFALRRDKSVVWSPSGKSAITYRVVSGVALVSGDPIGDPEAWPGAIEAYRAIVERHGWTPAVMGCGELAAAVFRREYGLRALALGDEAVLETSTFSLTGRAMRSVRQACTRVARAGYVSEVHRVGVLDGAALDELRTAAESWRGDAVERGYSMALGRLGDSADPDCVVVTVRRNGELHGLLHFVPWGAAGLSLDLMRRDRASDNGLNEFMIAALMQAAAGLGVQRVSLNFAVFRDALERGERIGAGPVSRLWRRLLVLASRWWQIETLYRFNDRFQPAWIPRYISYPAARDLPRIALAAMEAEAFVVQPRFVRLLLGRA